jgi:DnaJ-like protein
LPESAGSCGEPTDYSLADFYAILGLDADASADTIKASYRRLARQFHPDVAQVSTEAQKASAESHMAQLNEAYAVLSNPRSRREYDERLRLELVLASKTVTRTVAETRTGQTQTSVSRTVAGRVRPRHEVDSTVVTQFSGHLREAFANNRKKGGFSWSPVALEGFDWGLEYVTWSTSYCVALRGFATIDAAIGKKVVNYSDAVIGHYKRTLRTSHHLFLLPFLQMSEWDTVSTQIQGFLRGRNSTGASLTSTGVILLDMHNGRTLRLGCRFSDKHFESLIQSMRNVA